RLALGADGSGLRAEMPIRVDLHLDAAIGEDALGDYGHEVHAFNLLADDEGRGLVVGVGCAGTDAAHKAPLRIDQRAVPWLAVLEGDDGAAVFRRVLQDRHGIAAHDPAAEISIAVAGAG